MTNVRSFLLNPDNKEEVKQKLVSRKNKLINEDENGSWSLDLNNIDGSFMTIFLRHLLQHQKVKLSLKLMLRIHTRMLCNVCKMPQ